MTLLGLVLTLCALGAGALISLQAPINAEAAVRLGHPIAASTLSFCVGAVALIAITSLFLRQDVNFAALKTMPLYILISGGLLGAMYVTASLVLAPRIGVAALIALGITGQLVAALRARPLRHVRAARARAQRRPRRRGAIGGRRLLDGALSLTHPIHAR